MYHTFNFKIKKYGRRAYWENQTFFPEKIVAPWTKKKNV